MNYAEGNRANLGCGGQIADGWVNIDRGCGPGIWCSDLAADPLPFAGGQLDYAVCHHVLDLMTPDDAMRFLMECKRALRSGGTLRISLADVQRAIEAAEQIDDEWFAPIGTHWAGIQQKLDYYLRLGGARQMFLTTTLAAHLLTGAGFRPYVVAYRHSIHGRADGLAGLMHEDIVSLDTRPEESIWLEGVA